MANLHNDTGAMALKLRFVDRETGSGRLLAEVAVQHFDKRDKAFWPFVHVAVVWLSREDGAAILNGLETLVRGEVDAFSFRSQHSDALAMQVGKEGEKLMAEVGLDLSSFISENSGSPTPSGEALALFRFLTTRAEVVTFAAELKQELAELTR